MDNKVLVLAGMHRSFTSLAGNWLHACGLNIGDKVLGAGLGNTDGHFEDLDFLNLHEELLSDHQVSGKGFISGPLAELSTYQKKKLKALIGFKNSLHPQWGWKEPRTCLFLDHYREIIPQAYYLIIIRDFNSTVNSLIQRDLRQLDQLYESRNWFSRQYWKRFNRSKNSRKRFQTHSEFYLSVWVNYNEMILKHMRSLPQKQFMLIDHHKLKRADHKIFYRLTGEWEFSLQYTAFSKIYKKELLSEASDIRTYITDHRLMIRARAIEKELTWFL